MKIFDLLRLCFDNLRRRKGRTLLTAIGVMIGTCAIIVMVSFGVAINKSQEDMMKSWGDLTQIVINNYNASTEIDVLDDKKIAELEMIENVIAITPIYQSQYLNAEILAGKKDKYSCGAYNVYGFKPEAIEAMGYKLESGEYFDAGMDGKKIPVLVGQYAAYGFEDTTKSWRSNKRRVDRYMVDDAGNPPAPFFDVLKEKLSIRSYKQEENGKQFSYELAVKGVMVEDYSKGWYTSEGYIMDIALLKKLEAEYKKINNIKDNPSQQQSNGYQQVFVKVDDVKNVEAVEKIIKDQGYETYSMTSQREQMQKQAATMQMIFGGIGAISLFVAAIGIANTMVMSIYERTKEIGVMKVLGCRLGEIRKMFLIEAAAIGLLGGVIGVIISYALSWILNMFAPAIGAALGMYEATQISIIPVWLVLLGLGFSCLVGLVSGIFPANKAVKISALEAIRHE